MKRPQGSQACRLKERPPQEFWRFFSGPELYASQDLWQAYSAWRRQRLLADFELFRQACLEGRRASRQAMERLPNPFGNAVKGKPYEASFRLPAEVCRFRINGLAPLGLHYDYDSQSRECRISGVPTVSGDCRVTIHWIWPGWRKGLPLLQKACDFTINPDPAELWQDLPSDPDGEYARPDYEFASLACAGGRMWGASLRGRAHAHRGLPRDDAFALGCLNGWQLMAVSDGAGSASFSRRGAELACQTALQTCRQRLEGGGELERLLASGDPGRPDAAWLKETRRLAYGILPQAAFAASKAIRAEAAARGRSEREYAATLLLCLAKAFPTAWAVLAFQIGDGAMAALHGQAATLLGAPDEGEYGGQTRFVTMREVFEPHELMRRLKVMLLADLQGILMLTDGVSDARFQSQEDLASARLWQGLWQEALGSCRYPEPESALRQWLNFWSRGNHDDRTLTLFAAGA